MGMSATQARFLQLTARRSNVEYQAQRICFERLQLADQNAAAAKEYNEAISNRKLVYTYNDGEGRNSVDVTYKNYKNYMNQQGEGVVNAAEKVYLVSSSGNKIIVSNEEEMQTMINQNVELVLVSDVEKAKQAAYSDTPDANDDNNSTSEVVNTEDATALNQETDTAETIETEKEKLSDYQKSLALRDFTDWSITEIDGTQYYSKSKFEPSDFMIVSDLDDVENFQRAITEGIYYFATYNNDDEGSKFKTLEWATFQGGAVRDEYDKSDDAAAEAKYNETLTKNQSTDKKLELELDKLNTERDALTTEIETLKKVIDDDIEQSFKVFS